MSILLKFYVQEILCGKKRKRASVDKSLSNVLEKLTDQEKAADKRFIELEEQRMKLEE